MVEGQSAKLANNGEGLMEDATVSPIPTAKVVLRNPKSDPLARELALAVIELFGDRRALRDKVSKLEVELRDLRSELWEVLLRKRPDAPK